MRNFEVGQLIARAWADQEFKARLLKDPGNAAKECSIAVPDNLNLRVHVNSSSEFHIVIPEPPYDLELANAGADTGEDRGGCWLPCRGNNSW